MHSCDNCDYYGCDDYCAKCHVTQSENRIAELENENERLKRGLISIGTELDEHWETDRWNGILDTISDIVDETLEQAIAPDVWKEGW